jgi:stearoyl-CoA desaturase (delta-9 desaturase)
MTGLPHVQGMPDTRTSAAAAVDAALDRQDWKAIPFWLVHAVALATPFLAPVTGPLLALVAASYLVRMFGVTAGLHRYFSHRSYRTIRPFQLLLALLATTTVQKGVLWWAAHHRHHHRTSDTPDDVHSPLQRGFWWAHLGWILSRRHDATQLSRVRDLARYPELLWLDRHYLLVNVATAATFFALGGWAGMLWGFFVSTVLLWHGTFLVNSLTHLWGRRRYPTADGSRNSLLIALVTLGEGWHNNHHHYPTTANQGWFWWEIDVTYYVLRTLELLGLVHDLRLPPAAVRDGRTEALAPPPPVPDLAL